MPEYQAPEFESQKREFFTKLGLRARQWLEAHRDLGGLWQGPSPVVKDGIKKKQRWENVSEHCLVEAARVEVFAGQLGLGDDAKQRLFAAAVLHDFNKKEEIVFTKARGGEPEAFDEIYAKSKSKLLEAGIDAEIVEIVDSVGHTSAPSTERIVNQKTFSEQEIARLILHYVDDYTKNAEWVEKFDGKQNDFDKRMEAVLKNPNYKKVADAGFYKEQLRVGLLVENKLAALLNEQGIEVEAKRLPEFIDAKVIEKIQTPS